MPTLEELTQSFQQFKPVGTTPPAPSPGGQPDKVSSLIGDFQAVKQQEFARAAQRQRPPVRDVQQRELERFQQQAGRLPSAAEFDALMAAGPELVAREETREIAAAFEREGLPLSDRAYQETLDTIREEAKQQSGYESIEDQELAAAWQRHQEAMGQSGLFNFSQGTINSTLQLSAGMVGIVDPEAQNIFEDYINERYTYDPNRVSGAAAQIVGNTIPIVPAIMSGGALVPAMTAGLLASSEFGQTRGGVARRRLQGEEISRFDEFAGAGLNAAAEYVFERFSLGATARINRAAAEQALSRSIKSKSVNKVSQQIMRLGEAAGVNVTEEMATQVAQNAVDRYVLSNEQRKLTDGLREAMTTGGGVGALAYMIGAPVQLRRLRKINARRMQAGLAPVTIDPATDSIVEVPEAMQALTSGAVGIDPKAFDTAELREAAKEQRAREEAITPLPQQLQDETPVHRTGPQQGQPIQFDSATDKAQYIADNYRGPKQELALDWIARQNRAAQEESRLGQQGEGPSEQIDPVAVVQSVDEGAEVLDTVPEEFAEVEAVAQAVRPDVRRVYYRGGQGGGAGFFTQGTQFINVGSRKAQTPQGRREIVIHELTHSLEQVEPDLVNRMYEAIPQERRDAIKADYKRMFEKAMPDQTLTEANLNREVVPLAVGRVMQSKAALDQVAGVDRGVVRQVIDAGLGLLRGLTTTGRVHNEAIKFLREAKKRTERRAGERRAEQPRRQEVQPVEAERREAPERRVSERRGPTQADIRRGRERAVRLGQRAQQDPLTKLGNRAEFNKRGSRAMIARNSGSAVVAFDLANLKALNDVSHQKGDEALQAVAAALNETVAEVDGASAQRLGGDEFAMILPGVTEERAQKLMKSAQAAVTMKLDAIDARRPQPDRTVFLDGAVFFKPQGVTIPLKEAYDKADRAGEAAKRERKREAGEPVERGEAQFLPDEGVDPRRVYDEAEISDASLDRRFLEVGDWTLLTAENPNGLPQDEDKNAKAMSRLEKDLDKMGYEYVPITGVYGQKERSFLVKGMARDDYIATGKKYKQESVANSVDGLVYMSDLSRNPLKEPALVVGEDALSSGYFSVANIGGEKAAFHLNVDFSQTLKKPAKRFVAKRSDLPKAMRPHVLDEMLGRIKSKAVMDNMVRAWENEVPKLEEAVAMAQAGMSVKGQYEQMSRILTDMFGYEGGAQIALLNAAFSAQQAVGNHFMDALKMFRIWQAEGSPRDDEGVQRAWDAFIAQDTGAVARKTAHKPNVFEVLKRPHWSALNRGEFTKSSNFSRNTMGDLSVGVFDTHMAKAVTVVNPVDLDTISPTEVLTLQKKWVRMQAPYYAYQARLSEAAAALNWQVGEVQEAMWSTIITMTVLKRKVSKDAETIINSLRHEIVSQAWDNLRLLQDGKVQDELRRLGVDEATLADVIAERGVYERTPNIQLTGRAAEGEIARNLAGLARRLPPAAGLTGRQIDLGLSLEPLGGTQFLPDDPPALFHFSRVDLTQAGGIKRKFAGTAAAGQERSRYTKGGKVDASRAMIHVYGPGARGEARVITAHGFKHILDSDQFKVLNIDSPQYDKYVREGREEGYGGDALIERVVAKMTRDGYDVLYDGQRNMGQVYRDIPAEAIREVQQMSPAERRRTLQNGVQLLPDFTLDSVKPLWERVKANTRSRGDLPSAAFDAKLERSGAIQADVTKARYALKSLHTAIRARYGVAPSAIDADVKAAINNAMQDPRQVDLLDPALRPPVIAMRQHIDELSTELTQTGIISDDLAAVVQDNIGAYLTRAYRVFEDPKWVDNIPEDVRNRAEAAIYQKMRMNWALNYARQQVGPLTTEVIESIAFQDAMQEGLLQSIDHVNRLDSHRVMLNLLEDYRQGDAGVFGPGKLTARHAGVLFRRKDLLPEIRALLGEYTSPDMRYLKSVERVGTLLAQQQFLQKVKDAGMGTWLFRAEDAPDGYNTEIIGAGQGERESVFANPLAGLRTTREIADELNRVGVPETPKPFMRIIYALNGVAKTAKTLGSMMTTVRNYVGNAFFAGINGHWDARKLSPAAKTVINEALLRGNEESQAFIDKLTRLGVLTPGVRAAEIQTWLNDVGIKQADDTMFEDPGVMQRARRWAKGGLFAIQKAYQVADSGAKVYGYLHYLDTAREAFPEMSEAERERWAANRTRATYPAYEMSPRLIRYLIRNPVVAPFATFWGESVRTAVNSFKMGLDDVKSGNPVLRREGAKKLVGVFGTLAAAKGVEEVTKLLIGMDGEEEEDMRVSLPPWERNATLAMVGRDANGSPQYINVGYVDPYSFVSEPIFLALMGGRGDQGAGDAFYDAMAEFVSPLYSEQIFSGAAVDVLRNTTRTGRPVYNPQDTWVEFSKAVGGHLLEPLEPGTITRVRKNILPALRGQDTTRAITRDPMREIAAEFTGVRLATVDYKTSLTFASRSFGEDVDNARSIFTRQLYGPRAESPRGVLSAYDRMERARYASFRKLHGQVRAFLHTGGTEQEAHDLLVAGGVSQTDATGIVLGRYVPYNVYRSKAVDQAYSRLGDELPIQDILDRYHERQNLYLGTE